jgi:hypothetical protein
LTLFDDEPICALRESTFADSFYTPAIALTPLLPFLRCEWRIWEPCCGGGHIVRVLGLRGFCIFGSDIIEPYGRDFLTWQPAEPFDAIVTNPPYSKMDDCLQRAYSLGKPFAFLLPVYGLGGKRRQDMYRQHSIEILMLGQRINFRTPTGKSDKNGSSATFETAWFTWGLNIGQGLTFAQI